MKRAGSLFDKITSFENLHAAARAACRGKRFRADVSEFHFGLERNLILLQRELCDQTYRPGAYRTFWIRDPKRRLISAAPYRDRIVHHAVCRIVEPIFDRSFISDSYANRREKGTHAALDRAGRLCRRFDFVLKCDVEKYFPSIDHTLLLGLVARKLKCRRTLALLEGIVENSNPQEEVVRYFPGDDLFVPHERRRGLPIGNLTSQILANVMLDPMDHFVKETLRRKGYVRFADDFLVFGNHKNELHEILRSLRRFLETYRLRLHDRKCVVGPSRCGVSFLGWTLFPDGRRRVRRATGLRFQRRLRELTELYRRRQIDLADVRQPLASWLGHLKHGNTDGLVRRLLRQAVFLRQSDGVQA